MIVDKCARNIMEENIDQKSSLTDQILDTEWILAALDDTRTKMECPYFIFDFRYFFFFWLNKIIKFY